MPKGATTDLTSIARSHTLDRLIAFAISTLIGLGLQALLRRALFEGQAQSHDAALYVRSLWGIAHGDYNNSLIDYPSLAIHSQFALLPLAPLARIWHPADVLIAAQALTFAATLYVWLSALLRARRAAGPLSNGRVLLLAAWASVLFSYATPLLGNPFVFDVRPELLGVFFASAGLLRAAERGSFDIYALALLVFSVATREEFALIAACGLVLAPVPRTGAGMRAGASENAAAGVGTSISKADGFSLRVRCVVAGVLVVFFLGNSYFWPRPDSQAAHLSNDGSLQALLLSKLQLAAAFAGTAGGLAWLGVSWFGSALPGLGVLALSTWMPDAQISFHYGMFVAPALLTASYAGYRATLRRLGLALPRPWLAAHVAIALACATLLSALPGGARFARPYFDLEGPLLSPATWQHHTPWLQEAHQLLRTLPADHSLLLQYMLAVPYANRAGIRVLEVENPKPWQPDTVVLPRKLWASRGRKLREQGYNLARLSGPSFAMLSRRMNPPLASVLAAQGCEQVSVRWPEVGLDLCNAWREPDGRVKALLGRRSSEQQLAAVSGMRLSLRAGTPTSHITMPLALLDGLVAFEELPAGRVAWCETPKPVPNAEVTITLTNAAGQAIPLSAQGHLKDQITLTLLPP